MSWPLVKLAEVAQVNPRLPKDIDEKQEVTFLPMAAVSEAGELLEQEKRILFETKKGFTYFEKNDVIIAKITPCFENGKASFLSGLETQIGFGSTEFHVVRANTDKLDPNYLFYLIWSNKFRHIGELNMTGSAGQKRVPADFLKSLKIPLPPLKEQKRIVNILAKAKNIDIKRQESSIYVDDFINSTFVEIFGDPVRNDKKWKEKSINEVTFDWRGGAPFKPDDFSEEGVNVLHKGAIKRSGKIIIDTRKKTFTSEEFAQKYNKSEVDSEYVAVTLRDLVPAGPSIGLISTLNNSPSNRYILAQGAYGFKTKRDEVLPNYMVYLSNNVSFRSTLIRYWVGSTQIHIRTPIFKAIQIPIPPIELQLKFDQIVVGIEKNRLVGQSSKSYSEELFNSLSQKAFSGEL